MTIARTSMLTRLGVPFETEGSMNAEWGHTSSVSYRPETEVTRESLTRSFICGVIPKFEQK